MRLTVQDKYEIVKAAARATDLDSFKQWVLSIVDAIDDLPEGKADAAVPRYVPAATGYAAVRATPRPASREWANDCLVPNGSGPQ